MTENIYNKPNSSDTISPISVVELTTDYRCSADFANLNKNNTIEEYRAEIAKGDFRREAVKVTHLVKLSGADYYDFIRGFLEDRGEWLAGLGGNNSDYDCTSRS